MADVLIVDDDVELAIAECEVLALYGHQVRVAYDGRAGIAALRERLPDVILLDIEMPVLDGPGMVYQMFIEDAGRDRIPVVLTSGHAGLAEVAMRLGTPYAIAKPCGIDVLLALTERALRERKPPKPGPRTTTNGVGV